jgi:hypothetical protein
LATAVIKKTLSPLFKSTIPKLKLEQMNNTTAEHDMLSNNTDLTSRRKSHNTRLYQPLALRALKVATDRTKTHFKGAQDYLMSLPHNAQLQLMGKTGKGVGYINTSMYDRDLNLASILD